MRQGRLIALVGLAIALAMPAGAMAQDDEVFVDPDSPTGREYDIPLERARRDASPELGARDQPSRSRSAELFGEGISEPAAGGPGGSPSREARTSAALPEPVRAAMLRPGAPEGGAGSSLLFGGAGLLVIALGVGGGVLLRRARG